MADRIPLIVNSTANQIQELPTGDHLQLNDSNKLKIGNSGDLEIFHSSSNSILNDTGTGNLLLQIGGSTIVETNPSGVVISGICTADSFSGNGVVPIGGIIMWSGAISAIPTNFKLCNGNNGTPDLRNKFIVGATNDSSGTTYPGLQPGATGGSADATLVSHSHTTNSIIEHQDVGNSSKQLTGGFSIDAYINGSGIFENIGNNNKFIDQNNNADHTNTISFEARHRHGTDTQGVSATNKNLPPYYALAYIMRTA